MFDLQDVFHHPEFWLAHLLMASTDVEWLYEALGYPLDHVYDWYEKRLTSEVIWPAAELALPGGYTAAVVYYNDPDDADGRIYFNHPRWKRAILAGRCGGNFQLPALRWEELELLAATRCDQGMASWEMQMLFLPGGFDLTEAQLPRAVKFFVEAFECIAPYYIDVEPIAEKFAVQGLSLQDQWTRSELGWVCDWHHSRRDPKNSHCLTQDEFLRLDQMFTELEQSQRTPPA